MSERRTKLLKHGSGYKLENGYSLYPTTAYQVVDIVTGEIRRIGKYSNSFVFNEEEAVEYIEQIRYSTDRLMIVKLEVLQGEKDA